jgi:ubiquinone biosynthesis protein
LRKRGEEEKRRISLAERVRLVAMDLGPSFVKLGQIASTRPDLLPAEWIRELKKLQDEVTPVPFEDIQQVVEVSLGAPLDEIYESFAEKPIASASIAQVHRAILKSPDGPIDVAVKVQRPKISDTVARDVDLLHTLARFIERTIPESHIYQPSALVDQFDSAITAELDFALEADNARRFAHNFEGHPHAAFPFVYRDASSKRVLTMEYLDGAKIYDAIEKHGHRGSALAKAATGIVIKMVFEDGFFHADPHPGNILISGDPDVPKLGLVDLGMVGRLTPEMRNKLIDMMIAASRNDHEALADALYTIGTPTQKVDMRAYRAEVAMLADKYLGKPLGEIDFAQMLGDLVKGATKYGIEIPADFLLVGKALMTMDGVGKEIDPTLDVFNEARPYFMDLLRKRYAPERVANDVWRGLERLSAVAYDMPQQVREVMDDLRMGRLTVRTQDSGSSRMLDRLGRRVFAGLVVCAFILAGAWLVPQGGTNRLVGFALVLFGLFWMFWHVVLDLRRR